MFFKKYFICKEAINRKPVGKVYSFFLFLFPWRLLSLLVNHLNIKRNSSFLPSNLYIFKLAFCLVLIFLNERKNQL